MSILHDIVMSVLVSLMNAVKFLHDYAMNALYGLLNLQK